MKYLILSILLSISVGLYAQESNKKSRKEQKAEKTAEQKEKIKDLIENKSFVFEAQTAYSTEFGTKNLSTYYNVDIDTDSVNSYLPYYGRTYTVDYSSTESPMIFNLPVKEFEIQKMDKKGYQVEVKVKKGMDNIKFNFTISESGFTTLTVNSSHRQVITYYGELADKNKDDSVL